MIRIDCGSILQAQGRVLFQSSCSLLHQDYDPEFGMHAAPGFPCRDFCDGALYAEGSEL